jgi:HEAT repeat protein
MKVVRNRRLMGLIALGLFAAAAGVVWWHKTTLEACYYGHRLANAGQTSRDVWIERAARLGEAIIPRLLDCLAREEALPCENAEMVFRRMTESRASAGVVMNVSESIAREFPRFSHPGKQVALRLHSLWLNREEMAAAERAGLARSAMRLLEDAVRINDPELRDAALNLASLTPLDGSTPELVARCRGLAQAFLTDAVPERRARALRLHVAAGGEAAAITRFLDDPEPLVRREAILAVGSLPAVVATDDLVYWLHDPDGEVRRICEAALRGRGLQHDQIRLARLITDRQPSVRLEVLNDLISADVEPGVWLRRLTQDQAPAVRVAAMRAAVDSPLSQLVDINDRIGQMAQSDPNPTVCQLARFYLSYPKQRVASEIR